MTHEQPSEHHDYQQALAEIDNTSTTMVNSTDVPPGFLPVFAGLVATVLTLAGVGSWSMVLAVAALGIPLALWYFLYMRKRAKPRSILKPSRSYFGYLLVLILLMQFIRFWEVSSWGEAGVQWLVIFVIFWGCATGMRVAWKKDRVREAHASHL